MKHTKRKGKGKKAAPPRRVLPLHCSRTWDQRLSSQPFPDAASFLQRFEASCRGWEWGGGCFPNREAGSLPASAFSQAFLVQSRLPLPQLGLIHSLLGAVQGEDVQLLSTKAFQANLSPIPPPGGQRGRRPPRGAFSVVAACAAGASQVCASSEIQNIFACSIFRCSSNGSQN